jgi:hypothetical protein
MRLCTIWKSRGLDTKSKNQGALIYIDFGGVHELLARKNG